MRSNGDTYVSGNLGIGTTDTKGYKFAVTGAMITEKLFVKLQANWPDFVFQESYKLPALDDVEQYIRQHQHLPGIPSAKEVEEQDIDMGKMQANLLQKVEELTLYAIEQNKRISQLEKQNLELRQQLQ